MKDDRSRWRIHVAEFAPWIDAPMGSVTRSQAREWLSQLNGRTSSNFAHRRRGGVLAAQTLKNVINLVRRSFADAVEDEEILFNPFVGLKIHRSRAATTRKKWTVLRAEEQIAALASLPTPERWIAGVAMGSGIRQGEQWSLLLLDVDVASSAPHMVIRFGSASEDEDDDGPTKAGEPRSVPLFGLALSSMRAWLGQLEEFLPTNPLGLVFPSRAGSRRCRGKSFRSWRHLERVAGRHVRWHDLRHTCASSLVGGWWGSAWTLEEVRVLLGHSTISVTEKYAHFASETATRAAARMPPAPDRPPKVSMTTDRIDVGPSAGQDAAPLGAVAKRLGNGLQTRTPSPVGGEESAAAAERTRDRRPPSPFLSYEYEIGAMPAAVDRTRARLAALVAGLNPAELEALEHRFTVADRETTPELATVAGIVTGDSVRILGGPVELLGAVGVVKRVFPGGEICAVECSHMPGVVTCFQISDVAVLLEDEGDGLLELLTDDERAACLEPRIGVPAPRSDRIKVRCTCPPSTTTATDGQHVPGCVFHLSALPDVITMREQRSPEPANPYTASQEARDAWDLGYATGIEDERRCAVIGQKAGELYDAGQRSSAPSPAVTQAQVPTSERRFEALDSHLREVVKEREAGRVFTLELQGLLAERTQQRDALQVELQLRTLERDESDRRWRAALTELAPAKPEALVRVEVERDGLAARLREVTGLLNDADLAGQRLTAWLDREASK